MRHVFGSNANARVRDAQLGPARLRHNLYGDLSSWRRIAERVVDQVYQQLHQAGLVAQYSYLWTYLRGQPHAALNGQRLHGLYNVVDQLSQVDLLPAQELLASVCPSEREQLAYQPTHACRVFAQARQQLSIFLWRSVPLERDIDLAGQHGQRRAQLV